MTDGLATWLQTIFPSKTFQVAAYDLEKVY